MGAARRAPAAAVFLLLCLAATSDVEAVGTAGRLGLGMPTVPANETERETQAFNHELYGYTKQYDEISEVQFFVVLFVLFSMLNFPFRNMAKMTSCKTGKKMSVFRIHELDSWKEKPINFLRYTPVLVTEGDDKETPYTAVPYNPDAATHAGFIAVMIHHATDWKGERLYPDSDHSPLLIGFECHEFTEEIKWTMGWADEDLNEWLLDDSRFIARGTAKGDIGGDIKDGLLGVLRANAIKAKGQVHLTLLLREEGYNWCPDGDKLALTTKTCDPESWGFKSVNRNAPYKYMKKLVAEAPNEDVDEDTVVPTTEGRRPFHLREKGHPLLIMLELVIYAALIMWTYICTRGTYLRMAARDDVSRSLVKEKPGMVNGGFNMASTVKSPVKDVDAGHNQFTGLFIPEAKLEAVGASLGREGEVFGLMITMALSILIITGFFMIVNRVYASMIVRHWFIKEGKAKIGVGYDRLNIYLGVIRQMVLVGCIIVAPTVHWVLFKSTTWANAYQLVNGRIGLTWTNYFLAMLYLANSFMKYLAGFLDVPLSPLMPAEAADLILALTAALTAMLDLTEVAREVHGWGVACTFADLAYTMRGLVREGIFSEGSSQELYCTHSDMTFERLLNVTTETHWDDLETAVVEDGGLCNLVCSLENAKGQLQSITYPIVCLNRGMSLARWSLTLSVDDQKHRLCPPRALLTAKAG